MAQSQGIFDMNQVPIVVDHCTKYEQKINPFFSVTSQYIKFMKNSAICISVQKMINCALIIVKFVASLVSFKYKTCTGSGVGNYQYRYQYTFHLTKNEIQLHIFI